MVEENKAKPMMAMATLNCLVSASCVLRAITMNPILPVRHIMERSCAGREFCWVLVWPGLLFPVICFTVWFICDLIMMGSLVFDLIFWWHTPPARPLTVPGWCTERSTPNFFTGHSHDQFLRSRCFFSDHCPCPSE